MTDGHPNYKSEGGLPRDWTCRGPLESGREPSQPPAHGNDIISRFAPRVLGGPGDGDRRPRCQADPTAYGHKGGGPLQGLSGYSEVLRHLTPGKGFIIYCSVWGRSQDSSNSLNVLGPNDHVNQYRRVLQTPVQGIPRCHADQTPVPQNLQRGRESRHMPLGDGGDTIRGGHRGTWYGDH